MIGHPFHDKYTLFTSIREAYGSLEDKTVFKFSKDDRVPLVSTDMDVEETEDPLYREWIEEIDITDAASRIYTVLIGTFPILWWDEYTGWHTRPLVDAAPEESMVSTEVLNRNIRAAMAAVGLLPVDQLTPKERNLI